MWSSPLIFHEKNQTPKKAPLALGYLALAFILMISGQASAPVALLVGALGMIVSGIISLDDAYDAVSWKTVFLLAGLIPLGIAVQTTGAAAWLVSSLLPALDGVALWQIEVAMAIIATLLTIFMSNVGATVLLVPMAVQLAFGLGADPRLFALIVALSTSNAFLLPTHQANALICGPGGYRVMDFLKTGAFMSIIYLIVMLGALKLIF